MPPTCKSGDTRPAFDPDDGEVLRREGHIGKVRLGAQGWGSAMPKAGPRARIHQRAECIDKRVGAIPRPAMVQIEAVVEISRRPALHVLEAGLYFILSSALAIRASGVAASSYSSHKLRRRAATLSGRPAGRLAKSARSAADL